MNQPFAVRPAPTEHAPYYSGYIGHVPDGDVLATLATRAEASRRTLIALGEARAAHRYAPGKWSIKQVVGHVIDGERLFAYRALAFARNDPGALPSMDQDQWMAAVDFDRRAWVDLVDELWHVRQSTVSLFRSFDAATLARRGVASDNPFTVRSLVWIVAGHELHHAEILHERYGVERP